MPAKVAILAPAVAEIEPLDGQVAIDWDDFRVFLTVAESGSHGKAAKALAISKSTVTRRIAKLEATIGARLFVPGRRGYELTFEGRDVLNDAKAAELSLTRAAARRAGPRSVAGDCKLLVSDGLASYWFPRFLPGFQSAYPNVDFRLFTTPDPGPTQRPPYDLQIQFSAAEEPDSIPVRLGTLHFMLFASPDYLTAYGRPEKIEDLSNHRMLDLTLQLTSKGRFSSFSTTDRAPATHFFSNSSAVLAEAVRSGAGIAMLPTYAVLVDPRFVPLLPAHHWGTGIFVNFDREVAQQPAVRVVLDYLKETIFDRKNMPWFRDDFVAPDPSWNELFSMQLGRSRLRQV
ncbi:MAG TPA: LysR family transcriptional regulator [Rhizomicrobium sp.]|nr:LysR family transcriptional regulator [Rhizomicrobium sp.]